MRFVKNQAGFTLIEILLAMALIGVLAGLSIFIGWAFVKKNDLDIASKMMVQALRRAQSLAVSMQGDSAWGAKISGQNITIFKGSSFALRDASADEVFNFASALDFSGSTEFVFSKHAGRPQSSGSLTLSNSLSQAAQITVNPLGLVSN